jgi:predicted permease
MKWSCCFKRRWEKQMHAEFEFHLENQIRDHMERGLTHAEAELRARQEFGGLELAKDECRDQRAFEPLDRLRRDLRQAFRSLFRTPAFALSAILTLALGIGANTAIFSALDAIVLRPLPYPKPDRLVIVAHYNPMLKYATYLSYPDFLDWQRGAASFNQLAAFTPVGFDLTNPGAPEHVNGYEVSANFFSTLGVDFAVGRSFSPDNDQIGGAPAVVISNRLWRERFNSDASVIGRSFTLNGSGYFITGVLRPGFNFQNEQADVYTPVGRSNLMFRQDRTNHDILCVGRLKDGISIAQAHAEMETVQEHIDQLNPATERDLRTSVVSLKQQLVGDVGQTLVLLLGAVGFVLLIACANVANLSLARSATRAREFSVRRALGASRIDIIRQLITESVLLSLSGGGLGLLLATVGLRAVLRAAPGNLPRVEDTALSIPVLLFAFIISIAVGIVFGLLPALKYSRTNLEADLREGARGSTARRQSAQNILVIIQIALALVLLSGAGLLFRTVNNLWAAKRGFDTQSVITFQIGLSPFVTQTASATRASYQQLTGRIREIPGVDSADLTALLPLGKGDNSGPFWIATHQPASMSLIPRANWYPTGPNYPRSMRIPLLKGRFLSNADNVHSPLVVLVDSVLAHAYFSGKDPLGQTLTIPHWGPPVR